MKIVGKDSIAGIMVNEDADLTQLVSSGGTLIAKTGQSCLHSGIDLVGASFRAEGFTAS